MSIGVADRRIEHEVSDENIRATDDSGHLGERGRTTDL